MMAGTGPRAYPGSMPGARNSLVQWVQEPRDQGEIVRQYTKVDHRLERQDNIPGLIVDRLLQVAMSEPRGRGSSDRAPGDRDVAVPQQPSLSRPAMSWWRRAARVDRSGHRPRRVAEWLVKADNPCVYRGEAGRDPESVGGTGSARSSCSHVPGVGGERGPLNFPTTHRALRHRPRIQGRRRPPRIGEPCPLYAAVAVAAPLGEDRMGRSRPGAVALQDYGIPCGSMAAGSGCDRATRHL